MVDYQTYSSWQLGMHGLPRPISTTISVTLYGSLKLVTLAFRNVITKLILTSIQTRRVNQHHNPVSGFINSFPRFVHQSISDQSGLLVGDVIKLQFLQHHVTGNLFPLMYSSAALLFTFYIRILFID